MLIRKGKPAHLSQIQRGRPKPTKQRPASAGKSAYRLPSKITEDCLGECPGLASEPLSVTRETRTLNIQVVFMT